MIKPLPSLADKLRVVEALIVAHRPFRMAWGSKENETYTILKSVAEDLRARSAGTAQAVLQLERKMEAAREMRHDRGRLCAVLDELVSRWAMVRQAMERFGTSLASTDGRRRAVFFHAARCDLDDVERLQLASMLEKYSHWCRHNGYVEDVRELSPDPEGHLERRGASG